MKIKAFYVTSVFVVLCQDALAQNTTQVTQLSTATTQTPECPHYRDPDVTKGGSHCCNSLYKEFRRRYENANLRLTNLLERLRAWNCSQFEEECEQRYFDFNRFTSLVYDRFCDMKAFERNCKSEFQTVEEIFGISSQDFNERDVAFEINRNEILLSSPCLQVQIYQYGQPYYEIARPLFAFCEAFWCGFDEEVLASIIPSSWLCIPSSCRASIVIVMVVCGILALAVVIANLTVIIVLARNPKYPSSQMTYKLSLAAADLLVGTFVLPSFISTLYIYHVAPYQRRTFDSGDPVTISNLTFNQSAFVTENVNDTFNVYYLPRADRSYVNFFGFMVSVSLMVSIFTLMFASFDRFQAINRPMAYDKAYASKVAKRSTIVLWSMGVILGILPTFVPELTPYGILAGGVLIAVEKEVSLIMHGIALVVPLLVVWIFTIAIHVIVKKQARYRKQLMSTRQNNQSRTERRLANTLAIMVGVFTACLLPAVIFVLVPYFVSSVNAKFIKQLTKKPASAFKAIELASVIILASNSLWNCFIYSFRNKEFRKDAHVLHLKIMTALGIVALKRSISNCMYQAAYDGRRKISSVFTTSDLRKKSDTTTSAFRKKSSATSVENLSSGSVLQSPSRNIEGHSSSNNLESYL